MNPARQFLALTPERRALAFADAATQRGGHAVILEKDFWVCWLLGVLFADPDVAPHLVFKGGTSLAKVFGAIDRFSEDVDCRCRPHSWARTRKASSCSPVARAAMPRLRRCSACAASKSRR